MQSRASTMVLFCITSTLTAISLCMPAQADDINSKGSFKITYTFLNMTPMKPVMSGKDMTVSTSVGTMAASNHDGKGLLHNMAGRCTAMTINYNANKTFETRGYCDYVDADGSHVFEKYDYPVQAQAVATSAMGSWLGGTGKYAGISGTFDIHSQRLSPLTEGVYQAIGEKIGSYTIEQTAVSK